MESILLESTLTNPASVLQGVQGSAKVITWANTPVYSYAARLSNAQLPAAPTDVIVIQGNANKTLKIQSVILSAESTAAAIIPVSIIRRTAANVGGTFTQLGYTPHDITEAAATAVVKVSSGGTAPTSLGAVFGSGNTPAGNGILGQQFMVCANNGGVAPGPTFWSLEQLGIKPWILRGVNDFIVINLNSATLPGGFQLDYEIDIEEDTSVIGG
jgi:hypothetical protein